LEAPCLEKTGSLTFLNLQKDGLNTVGTPCRSCSRSRCFTSVWGTLIRVWCAL